MALQVDYWGSIFVTGFTTGDLHDQTSQGGVDVFVMKLLSNSTRQWTVQSGGGQDEYAWNLALDGSGEAMCDAKMLFELWVQSSVESFKSYNCAV